MVPRKSCGKCSKPQYLLFITRSLAFQGGPGCLNIFSHFKKLQFYFYPMYYTPSRQCRLNNTYGNQIKYLFCSCFTSCTETTSANCSNHTIILWLQSFKLQNIIIKTHKRMLQQQKQKLKCWAEGKPTGKIQICEEALKILTRTELLWKKKTTKKNWKPHL